ncbi:hypothetical protein O3P69_011535 [Scylla paramamosain]|uniref:Uncharacterized protein n=1 Tax=Scylla paramamosain TaxID=85552 RepID=A0AAW0T696_SCYPA
MIKRRQSYEVSLKMLWVQLAHIFRRKAGQGVLWKWWLVTMLVVVCVFVLLLVFSLRTPRTESCKKQRTPPLTKEDVHPRSKAAMELRKVLRELQRSKELREPPRADSLLALQRILGLLDPRFVQQVAPSEQLQESLLAVDGDGNDSGNLEVCPERYLGPAHDPPYHTHAFTSDCDNQVALAELVTIALDASGFAPSLLQLLLQDIFRYRTVPVVVAVSSNDAAQAARKFKHVKVLRVGTSTPTAVRWTRILKIVNTKYVLVGRHIISFSPFSDLQRLLRVFRMTPDVAFVSAATRSEQGNWKVACYQSRLELFGFTLKEGYASSVFECMYCDAVGGPFLTTLAMFKETPLDTRLPDDVFFSDWFMRIHGDGKLGTLCPDVLFFTSESRNHPWEKRESWAAIAKKWGVTDIHLPGHTEHHFSCLVARLDCGALKHQHLAAPPCCLARLGFMLSDMIHALESLYIKVHLANVTVVDGVKGGLQPWVDDVHLAVRNTTHDFTLVVTLLKTRGFTVNYDKMSGEYHVQAFSHNVVLHPCSVDLESDLPPTQKQVSTRLTIGSATLPAPPNPGLYARGLLGPGSLLHRPLGEGWPPCLVPGHHACLNHLPVDGTVIRLEARSP